MSYMDQDWIKVSESICQILIITFGDQNWNANIWIYWPDLNQNEEYCIYEDSSRQENEKSTTKARQNRNLNPIFEFELKSLDFSFTDLGA